MPPQPATESLLAPCAAGFLQFDVKKAAVDDNLTRVEEGLAALSPPTPAIIVLPELWATGFAYEALPALADRTPELLARLQTLAGRHRVMLAGSLPEKGGAGGRCHNTFFLVGAEGLLGSYRKQHPFTPMAEERHFAAGTAPLPLASPVGRVGALVCYDLRFPELARQQAALGAGLLLVSGQWPAARLDHWRLLLRSRAVENQVFVVACNRCGTTDGTEFGGHSMIVAPDGAILQEAGAAEEGGWQALDPGLLAEVRDRFNTVAPSPYRFRDQDKVATLAELKRSVALARSVGKRIVFTNGCFDILHVGHVTYLEEARRLGDCLIVGLNSDASVRAIKGPERPVNGEADRARLLAALGCVDQVILFDEQTPHRLIVELMPDVLVKGGDWPVSQIVGGAEVTAGGGEVVTIPLVENVSTTAFIERLRSR